MNIDQSVQYYWNSNTRFNKPVKVIGVNDENYAVEADGHVYVVPKANISPIKKVIVTTAPKPDEPYWFTLTSVDWRYLSTVRSQAHYVDDVWSRAIKEILTRPHNAAYTNEWFCLSFQAANALLTRYHYDTHKDIKDIKFIEYNCWPDSDTYKSVVRQLWEEQIRRDRIVSNG